MSCQIRPLLRCDSKNSKPVVSLSLQPGTFQVEHGQGCQRRESRSHEGGLSSKPRRARGKGAQLVLRRHLRRRLTPGKRPYIYCSTNLSPVPYPLSAVPCPLPTVSCPLIPTHCFPPSNPCSQSPAPGPLTPGSRSPTLVTFPLFRVVG